MWKSVYITISCLIPNFKSLRKSPTAALNIALFIWLFSSLPEAKHSLLVNHTLNFM